MKIMNSRLVLAICGALLACRGPDASPRAAPAAGVSSGALTSAPTLDSGFPVHGGAAGSGSPVSISYATVGTNRLVVLAIEGNTISGLPISVTGSALAWTQLGAPARSVKKPQLWTSWWSAWAAAPTSETVTIKLPAGGWWNFVDAELLAFAGASQALGASATAHDSGANTVYPSVTINAVAAGSVLLAAGIGSWANRLLDANSLALWTRPTAHTFEFSTWLAEYKTATGAPGSFVLGTTGGTQTDSWALFAVEVLAAAPAGVAVAVSPKTAAVQTGGAQQLTATVTGSANTAVNWLVQEGAAGGVVTAAGLYTAPSVAGTYHVVATSQADGTSSDSATLTVSAPPPVAVAVSPKTAALLTGAAQQFTATVTGSANTAVTWAVLEGAAGGAVTAAGLYTAPSVAGTYHLIATSQADVTGSDSATLTVTAPPPVAVAVSPKNAAVLAGAAQQFSATVTGSANTAVIWSVQEGAAGGAVTASGLYTAPAAAGTYHVVATSQADATKSDSAAVTVTAAAPPGAPPTLDSGFPVHVGAGGSASPVAIPYFTSGSNRLLLLAIEANTISGLNVSVSGSVLSWQRVSAPVQSVKAPQWWTVWWYAVAALPTAETVTVKLPAGGWWNFVDAEVLSFAGANLVPGATGSAHDGGTTSAFPSVTINASATGSLLLAAGTGSWSTRSLDANSIALWTRPFVNNFDSTTWVAESKKATTAPGSYVLGTTGGNQTDTWALSAIEVLAAVPAGVAVAVSPKTPTLITGGAQQFTATVTGSANTAVIWSVQEGASGGTVTAAGAYTAPAVAGVYHLVATSQADATRSDTATVTVTPPPPVVVAVSPKTQSLIAGGSQQFTATVTGSANTAVTWSVQEGASGGVITAAGVYTAPLGAGTYHVVATSQADASKSDSAAVTVTAPPPVAVVVSPKTPSLIAGGSQQFTATVTGSANTGVTWSVQEGAAGGSVSAAGAYSAPATAGAYHVIATSLADGTKSDSATITVAAAAAPGAPAIDSGFPIHVGTGGSGNGLSITYFTPGSNRLVLLAIEANTISGLPISVFGSLLDWNPYGPPVQSVKSPQVWVSWWYAYSSLPVADTVNINLPAGGWWNFVDAELLSISNGVLGATATARDAGAGSSYPAVTITAVGGSGSMLLAAGVGTWSTRSLDANSTALWTRPFVNSFDSTTWLAERTALTPGPGAFTLGTVGGNQTDSWALSAIEVQSVGPQPVAIAINPKTPSLVTGATQQFTASVTNTANTAVTWSVQEGIVGGIITQAGVYTAPGSAGTFHVTGTSQADPTRSDTATLTVAIPPPASVTVAPGTASLIVGATQQFSATVVGLAGTAVTWSVQEGPSGGTISSSGVYAAPAAAGTYHVLAVSQADGTKSGTATIFVTAPGQVVMQGNDPMRTGWYPNQATLTPSLVSSGTFGQQFSTPVNGQIYAQPLVWNGTLLIATETNWIYGLDAISGAILWSRNLGTPFNAADLACGDLTPSVGITGTPVIDGATGTAYLVAKSYVAGSSGPTETKMHAIDVGSGVERPSFPVTIQGTAQNASGQTFASNTEFQRPALLLMNGVVYAAFGGHCDVPPYQGWVAGVTTAGRLSSLWTARAAAGQSGTGIWMAGNGLMSDRSGTFFLGTGNALGTGGTPTTPTPGNLTPSDLGESLVRMDVQSDGTLKATDFFTPYDAVHLDAIDADFGSGGAVGLPAPYFGTASIPRLLLATGKQGYLYLLNADALGGCQQGPGAGDQVVARVGPTTGVWSHPAVWPGDGGWVFLNPAFATFGFYKYAVTGTGAPTLNRVASSNDSFGFGSGAPVVTSNGTQSGSALVWTVWMADGSGQNAQLRAYDAAPTGSVIAPRFSAPIGAGTKFAAPGVSGGRIYVGARDGHVLGFGAPVVAPLTGSQLSFPSTLVGQSSTMVETLTAGTAVTVTAFSSSNAAFTFGAPSSPLPVSLAAGQTLTVPVIFTPSAAKIAAGTLTVASSAGPLLEGVTGVGLAAAPLLTVLPTSVSFGGVVVGGQLTGSATFTNSGSAALTINGATPPAPPFSATGLPPSGTTISSGQSFSVSLAFAPTVGGQYTDQLVVQSSGGTLTVPLSGNATVPGVFQVSPLSVDFGSVNIGGTLQRSFIVSNSGGSPLIVNRSKPPVLGVFVRGTDLFEGTPLAAGASFTETVEFIPTTPGVFTDTWSLNSDASASITTVTFTGTAVDVGVKAIPDPAAGGWQINGAASLLGGALGSQLQLTPVQAIVAGSAFWPTAIPSAGLAVSFDALLGGGTGGDGLALVLGDPAGGAVATSLGGTGGGLGFAGIPGFAVALDTTMPANNFVGLATNGGAGLTWLATSASVPSLRSASHHVDVAYAAGTLTVSLDGAPVITKAVALPPSLLIGFSGGAGSLTDNHAVSNVTISSGP